jgi:hypothetical protein
MNSNSLVLQVGMILLAVAIVFLYIKPTFSSIGETQASIERYVTEKDNVGAVNKTLADLVSKINAISSDDQKRLTTYMPDQVDEIEVAKDVYTIAKLANVYLDDISYEGEEVPSSEAPTEAVEGEDGSGVVTPTSIMPTTHSFSVGVSGTYEQIKEFLVLLEQNKYPLEVKEMSIAGSEEGILSSDITLVTYSNI